MNSKEFIDKITIEYLSGNKLKKPNDNYNSKNVNIEDIKFYKKRILNTTRDFLKKLTDISFNVYHSNDNILNNNSIEESMFMYINKLIYAYKQDDIKDIINNNNGFTDDYFEKQNNIKNNNTNNTNNINNTNNTNNRNNTINNDVSSNDVPKINIQDIDNNLFSKATTLKSKYDWSQYCKIEKKIIRVDNDKMPKINNIDLKDPRLRLKGLKNKKYINNIVK